MQSNRSCQLVEQYLAYLLTIKGHSKNAIFEYRLDLLQVFSLFILAAPRSYAQTYMSNINV